MSNSVTASNATHEPPHGACRVILPIVKNSSLGRSAVRCASRLDIANSAVMGPNIPDLVVGQACGPGPLQIVIYEFRGAGGDHQGRVDDGALPGVQGGGPGITGYGVGELWVPRADPQNPAVRHDAVVQANDAGRLGGPGGPLSGR